MMKTRVFVSSVIEGFEEYREACREGIENVDGFPLLVDDFTSLPYSSRNACLDGVASCEILIVVIGNRGGWIAPSGKLVVEEEYDEAVKQKKKILAFIQNVEHDDTVAKFIERISDYVDGLFRLKFNEKSDLQKAVERSLSPIIEHYRKEEVDLRLLTEKLCRPYKKDDIAMLRFVISPERNEEVIDPVSLDADQFKDLIFQVGHDRNVNLFSYEFGKNEETSATEIVVLQNGEKQNERSAEFVRLEITIAALIIIDQNITNCEEDASSYGIADTMIISEQNIDRKLKRSFAFSSGFFEKKDPYKRYDRFFYNVGLSQIGHRTLMPELPKNQSSFQMGNQTTGVITAFDKPRLVSRIDLSNPKKEIEGVLSLFRRRLIS